MTQIFHIIYSDLEKMQFWNGTVKYLVYGSVKIQSL